MSNNIEHFVWVEKYRPHKISDTILPQELKLKFQKFVDDKNIPNLILSGKPGIGKTTVAKAMLEELDCDYIVINGSMNGNIDTLRNQILVFASSVSFSNGRKYVIIDEADYLNPQSTQPAMRNFIEEYSKNCGFIFTCNHKNRIIDALHSRCSVIDFVIPNDEKQKLSLAFFRRASEILKHEKIEFDQKSLAEHIIKFFPDWRRVINELQSYSATGKIDSGILKNKSAENFDLLIDYLKNKKFNDMRKWVAENSDADSASLYGKLFEILPNVVQNSSFLALAIITLANYQYKEAFVANPEINRVAALAELMSDLDGGWK